MLGKSSGSVIKKRGRRLKFGYSRCVHCSIIFVARNFDGFKYRKIVEKHPLHNVTARFIDILMHKNQESDKCLFYIPIGIKGIEKNIIFMM